MASKILKVVLALVLIGLVIVFHVYAIGVIVITYIVLVLFRMSDTNSTFLEAIFNTNKAVKVEAKVSLPLAAKRVNTICNQIGEEYDSIKLTSEMDLLLAGTTSREELKRLLIEKRIDYKEFIARSNELEVEVATKRAANNTLREDLKRVEKMTPKEREVYKASRK